MFNSTEDKEKYIHPFNIPVNSKFGAPMGRVHNLGPEDSKIRFTFYKSVHFNCVKVPLNQGYDKGGTYWGMNIPHESLYCTYAFEHIEGTPIYYNAVYYCRATNRIEAKKWAKEFFGSMITFYK